MDKITQLKGEVASLECLVDCAKGNVSDFEGRLAEKRKQLAALEAERAGSREFSIVKLRSGTYYACPKDANGGFVIGDGTEPAFTVIEKKPIVITKAKADEVFDGWQRTFHGGRPKGLAFILNALGIDAVAAEE